MLVGGVVSEDIRGRSENMCNVLAARTLFTHLVEEELRVFASFGSSHCSIIQKEDDS